MIDDGNYNTEIYNYKYKKSKSAILPISEPRRLQRKGRVGRTADGNAYFLYPHSKTLNTQSNYDITIQDISDDLLPLLDIFKGGESEIFDIYGKIYLFHPDENYLIRNIGGEIINSLSDNIIYNSKNKSITSKKIKSFYDKLQTLLLVNNYNLTNLYELVNIFNKTYMNDPLKTLTGISKILMLFYGYVFNYFYEIAQILIFTQEKYKIINNNSPSQFINILDTCELFNNMPYIKYNNHYKTFNQLIKIPDFNYSDLIYDYKECQKYCDIYNYTTFGKFHENIFKIKQSLIKYPESIKKEDKKFFKYSLSTFNKIKEYIISKQELNILTAILILSNPTNICKSLDYNYYMPIYYGYFDYVIMINSNAEFAIYYDYNTETNMGDLIHPVNYINSYVNIFDNIDKVLENYNIKNLELAIKSKDILSKPVNIINLVANTLSYLKKYFNKPNKANIMFLINTKINSY